MASLGLHLLTVVLAVIFIFLGHIKLTPQFFPEYHTHVRNEFGKINKEFPFYQLTGWRPYAKHYRMGLGVAETVCGMLLFLGGAFSQSIANMILLVIITNAIITFQKLHYTFEYMSIALFIAFLLVLRLVLVSKSKAIKVAKRNIENKVE